MDALTGFVILAALRWFADSFHARARDVTACWSWAARSSVHARKLFALRDVPQQTKVLNSLLAQPQLRDIRAFMKDCPSNLTVYDPLIIKLLAKQSRDWDLFAAYALWKMHEHPTWTRQKNRARRLASRLWRVMRKSLDTARPRQ